VFKSAISDDVSVVLLELGVACRCKLCDCDVSAAAAAAGAGDEDAQFTVIINQSISVFIL